LWSVGSGSAGGDEPEIPEGAVLALRNVISFLEPRPSAKFKWDGKEYLQADILAVIQEQDGISGAAPT